MKMIHRITLAAVALLGFATAAPASAASCSVAPTNGINSTNGTITPVLSSGRWYGLHVPAGIAPGSQLPVLIDLHGAGETHEIAEQQTGWSAYSDQQKFIVAYGQALPGTTGTFWNYQQGSADVAYIRDIANDIAKTYCVDPQRIYIEGFSNGAVMAQRVACDAADKFAAAASHAGATPTEPAPMAPAGSPCSPSRPIGVMMSAGDQDSTQTTAYSPQARDMWVADDACSPTPTHTTDSYGMQDNYTGCLASVQVRWRILLNTTHQWPTGVAGGDLHNNIWNFLMSHTRP